MACGSQLAGIVRTQAAFDLRCPEDQVEVVDLRSGNSVRDFNVRGCGREEHYQAACNMTGSCQAYRPGEAAQNPVPASEALTASADDLKPGDEGVTTVVGDAPGGAEAGDEASDVAGIGDAELAEARLAAAGTPGTPDEAKPAAAGTPGTPDEAKPAADTPGEEKLAAAGTPSTPGETTLPLGEERAVTIRNNCGRRVVLYVGKQPGGDGRYMTIGSTNMISPRLRLREHVWLLDEQQGALTSVAIAGRTSEIEIAESCAGMSLR